MLGELLVIVGAELILQAAVTAMTLHDRRMDVLSGNYFSNQESRILSLDWNINWLTRLIERERKMRRMKHAPVRASNNSRPRSSPPGPSAPRRHGRIVETIFLNRRLTLIPLNPGLSDVH
jgi:hypothetical protein